MFSGQRLKEIREAQGMSQASVAKHLGISRSSYFNWENGKTKPNQKNLSVLAELFGVAETYFLSEHEIVEVYLELNEENRQEALRLTKALLEEQEAEKQKAPVVPLYSYKVFERLSAGTGYTYFGDGNYDEVFYDEELDHDFASWVFGDSMEPTYLNGEVVLIKQTGFDYDGAVYAVVCNSQTYIKRVYREENGLRLVSVNPKYEDLFISYAEDPRVVGIIVGNFMPLKEGSRNG